MRASIRLALRERLDQGIMRLSARPENPIDQPTSCAGTPASIHSIGIESGLPSGTSTNTGSDELPLPSAPPLECNALGQPVADLSDHQREALIDFIDLLAHWNSRYNLTAVRDPLEMIGRHLLDSLAALGAFDSSPVLDLGTGAGLPGIPLAIARPELQFVLLDSVGKKTRFVRQAAASLELANVSVVQARFESYQPEQKFATITARALAPLDALWSGSAHLRQPDGALLAYKGRRPDDEIAALGDKARAANASATETAARSTPRLAPGMVNRGATGDTTRTTTGPRVTVTQVHVPFVPGERHLIRID